jgi:hypothetical protein
MTFLLAPFSGSDLYRTALASRRVEGEDPRLGLGPGVALRILQPNFFERFIVRGAGETLVLSRRPIRMEWGNFHNSSRDV